jgi:hypothetical protein
MRKVRPADYSRQRKWNIDLQSVRPPNLKPAATSAELDLRGIHSGTAEYNSAGRTGQSPMFRVSH